MTEPHITLPQTHCMLDIETWDTSPHALIISIGAVKFDPNTAAPLDAFHVGIDLKSYSRCGTYFKINPETVLWWMAPERREALDQWLGLEKVGVTTALEGFCMWYGDKSLPTWSNGASFDNVILRHAYDTFGMQCPFAFYDERCFRTMKSGVPKAILAAAELELEADGIITTTHDALYDARLQALQLRAIRHWRGVDIL